MNKRDAAALLLVLGIALGLRLYGVTTPAYPWGDEIEHVASAAHYAERGHFAPNLWEHPPLRHLLLRGFLMVFGESPLGWRLRNVLFGALTAALVFLFVRGVGGSLPAATLGGLLMATDPLHVVLSRFTYEETYGVAFFMASVVLFTFARGRSGWHLASALLMGCALATKWYYVPVWGVIGLLALREDGNWRRPADALFMASVWILAPLLVYVLAYTPWFGRGYSVGEWVEITVNAYYSLQKMDVGTFNPAMPYMRPVSSLRWFTAPVAFGGVFEAAGDRGRYIVFGNGLAWALALPAVALAAFQGWKARRLWPALPALFFVATYALFLIPRRPSFIYNAAPLLPFAFAAVGLALASLADRLGRRVAWGLAGLLLAANLYLYPLVTAREVPVAAYEFVLSRVDFDAR
jgi:predicted membrane-bound dolichyl-phosphate-mannose-protein mannosyltransferase